MVVLLQGSLFFKESFLQHFGVKSGTAGVPWKKNHTNVYRRHNWKSRSELPEGWEGNMDGFRRLGIRWWRRNLHRSFRRWRELNLRGETGERWHCLPICDNNRSGIPFRRWIGRLLKRRGHCLPICDNNRSGIPFRRWIGRLLKRRGRAGGGYKTGWLFERDGRRGRLSDYDDVFVEYIELVHAEQPELFSKGTLLYMFSLWRSPRRGAVLETTGKVDITIVNLMNRWRIKEGAKGSAPGLTMRQTYTQVRDTLPQLKMYSKAL
jgi:hypothetical protein